VIKASSWIAANSINCWVDWTCETDVGGDDTDELVEKYLEMGLALLE
jgi:hypothetical protein